MANKIYKQTFKGAASVAEIHEKIGRHGGVIVRTDQTEGEITAYFAAPDSAAAQFKTAGEHVEEVSIKDVTKV